MPLVTHSITSGGGRRVNEDALDEVSGPGFSLLALADGLGGHGGGELAARACVSAVSRAFAAAPGLSDATLQALVTEADDAVASLRLQRRKSPSDMRTTLAMLAICENDARWAHVGDSRVYWFRDRVLMRRTRDHSVAELVTGLADVSLAAPPDETDRHRLLRAVGAGEGCRAELGREAVELQPGDAFLLCSDGVWSILSDTEITACLSEAPTPIDWCARLKQRLKENLGGSMPRGQDNYSMICAMVVQ